MNFFTVSMKTTIYKLYFYKVIVQCVSKEINIHNSRGTKNFLAHKEKILKMKNIKIFLFMSLKRPAIYFQK